MHAAIRSCDDQAFEKMNEESEKKTIVQKSLRSVPSQGMAEQAKKHGGFRPQRGYPGNALRPQRARWPSMAPDKGYN